MTPRADDDRWDIHTGVGYTALVVAAWRALHTAGPDPVAADDWARAFVEAAADPYLSGLLDAAPTADTAVFPTLYGVQTRFFDEFFTAASAAGIAQAVILGAGLDTRCYRLGWPDESVVFEVDQPAVLRFKTAVLAERAARPATRRVPIGADLRGPWAESLLAAGFEPGRPCAWSVEGVLPYLTGADQDALLTALTTLSAAGSRIAIGALGSHFDAEQFAAVTAEHPGLQIFRDVDFSTLTHPPEQRADPADWLERHGWAPAWVGTTLDLQADHGASPPAVMVAVDRVLRSQYVHATRR